MGIGVAACAVCCAGPIAGVFAAIGIGTAVGFALFGAVGALMALTVGLLVRRARRRRVMCTPVPEQVPVALGTRSHGP